MECCKKKCSYETIEKALAVLDKKNLAFIAHGGSFPSNDGADVGFGSPNSIGGRRLIDFCEGIFNCIQLGPAGKTKLIDSSPYTGTIFSNNPLFIDLEQLTTNEWKNILSEKTFNEIVDNNPKKNSGCTAYSYIFKANDKAMREAFSNFQSTKEFKNYKKENAFWLDTDSLYEVLTIEHGNDYWPLWNSDTDIRLLNPKNADEKKLFAKRIKELKAKYADEIEFYSFCQYVAFVQSEKTKQYAQSKGIKMIADRQVAFSDRDTWAYQSMFLDGWCLGCPPDYFSEDGQSWGFPVINPEKMFNANGTLGPAGILMKELYKKMFKENPGGVRIDHIVGLIDPWVYKKGAKPKIEEGAGRLYSSPQHEELSKFAIATLEDLNLEVEADKEKWIKKLTEKQVKKYGALIEKIVIGAALEMGLDKDSIVCEDLGTLTFPVESVMKAFDLQGMRLTQFVVPEKPLHPYRMCNIEPRSWAMVGTHDNEPIAMWADAMINTHEGYLHAKNLADDLYFELNDAQREEIAVKWSQDAYLLTQAKLVELFASKAQNLQIFFTDFLGVKDVYNCPGTCGNGNWSLRIPNNFEDFYCENIEKAKLGKGNVADNNRSDGLNLPLILKLAIEARGSSFVAENKELLSELEDLI